MMIHKTAEVSENAIIGENTKIWHHAQVRENAKIGSNCIISKGVYIDTAVDIGNNVKVQNYASVYHGAVVEDGAFIGPYVCISNDKNPRSINKDGSLKSESDWKPGEVLVKKGASVGARSTILPNLCIGSFALVGAGSVVTKDIPNHALAFGNPAKIRGFVCSQAHKLIVKEKEQDVIRMQCPVCDEIVDIEKKFFDYAEL